MQTLYGRLAARAATRSLIAQEGIKQSAQAGGSTGPRTITANSPGNLAAEMPTAQSKRESPLKQASQAVASVSRAADMRGARWDEISGNVWTIPGHRHKSAHEFRVLLSPRAVT